MGIFGPYYPPLLQLAISHAERFAVLLSGIEVCHSPAESAAQAWLTGRKRGNRDGHRMRCGRLEGGSIERGGGRGSGVFVPARHARGPEAASRSWRRSRVLPR
jgi:hypothetical protein